MLAANSPMTKSDRLAVPCGGMAGNEAISFSEGNFRKTHKKMKTAAA
jgi:hypothetical protein